MSDYGKIVVTGTGSQNSDYTNPDFTSANLFVADEFEYDEAIMQKVEAATTPGTAVSFSYLASIARVVIQNLDDTNYVTLTFNTAAGATTIVIPKGAKCVLPDVAVGTSLTFVANTAACEVALAVWGT